MAVIVGSAARYRARAARMPQMTMRPRVFMLVRIAAVMMQARLSHPSIIAARITVGKQATNGPYGTTYLNQGPPATRRWGASACWRCGSDCLANARTYLGARPSGRRRDGFGIDPQGAIPAARSLVGRRRKAGAIVPMGAGRKTACHLGFGGLHASARIRSASTRWGSARAPRARAL